MSRILARSQELVRWEERIDLTPYPWLRNSVLKSEVLMPTIEPAGFPYLIENNIPTTIRESINLVEHSAHAWLTGSSDDQKSVQGLPWGSDQPFVGRAFSGYRIA